MNKGLGFLGAMLLTAMVGCAGTEDEPTLEGDAIVADETTNEACAVDDPSCVPSMDNAVSTKLEPTKEAILYVRKAGRDSYDP